MNHRNPILDLISWASAEVSLSILFVENFTKKGIVCGSLGMA